MHIGIQRVLVILLVVSVGLTSATPLKEFHAWGSKGMYRINRGQHVGKRQGGENTQRRIYRQLLRRSHRSTSTQHTNMATTPRLSNQPADKKEKISMFHFVDEPCKACKQWKIEKTKKTSDENLNILIMPMAALLAFIFIITLKVIQWCNEDIKEFDQKHDIKIVIPSPESLARSKSRRSSAPNHINRKHSSLRGSPRRRAQSNFTGSPGEQEGSLEELRLRRLRRQYRQGSLDRRGSLERKGSISSCSHSESFSSVSEDSSSRTSSKRLYSPKHHHNFQGTMVTASVEHHPVSPELLSSPSSLGYASQPFSRSESFLEHFPPSHQHSMGGHCSYTSQAKKPVLPNMLTANPHLAQALYQLQKLGMVAALSAAQTASMEHSTPTHSTGSTTLPSPRPRSPLAGSSQPSLSDVESRSTQCTESDLSMALGAASTATCSSHDIRSRHISASSETHEGDIIMHTAYFEDPFILATPYADEDGSAMDNEKHLPSTPSRPRYQSNSSGLSSQHSSLSVSCPSLHDIESVKLRRKPTPTKMDTEAATSASRNTLSRSHCLDKRYSYSDAALYYTITCLSTPYDSCASLDDVDIDNSNPNKPKLRRTKSSSALGKAGRWARRRPHSYTPAMVKLQKEELREKLSPLVATLHGFSGYGRKRHKCHSWCSGNPSASKGFQAIVPRDTNCPLVGPERETII